MSTDTPLKETSSTSSGKEKPGFLARLWQKLDSGMKAKAEAQSKEGSCCCGEDKDSKCSSN
jgi:hypothetical protein